jgi:hypothetical protein
LKCPKTHFFIWGSNLRYHNFSCEFGSKTLAKK